MRRHTRGALVTGVQTCALPICGGANRLRAGTCCRCGGRTRARHGGAAAAGRVLPGRAVADQGAAHGPGRSRRRFGARLPATGKPCAAAPLRAGAAARAGGGRAWPGCAARMSVLLGKSVSVRLYLGVTRFILKQKTAYEMRISDWSSDVCSSDLRCGGRTRARHGGAAAAGRVLPGRAVADQGAAHGPGRSRRRFGARLPATGKPCAAAPLRAGAGARAGGGRAWPGGAGTASRSAEHTSELQSLMRISYAVFCLKKKKQHNTTREKKPNTAN